MDHNEIEMVISQLETKLTLLKRRVQSDKLLRLQDTFNDVVSMVDSIGESMLELDNLIDAGDDE